MTLILTLSRRMTLILWLGRSLRFTALILWTSACSSTPQKGHAPVRGICSTAWELHGFALLLGTVVLVRASSPHLSLARCPRTLCCVGGLGLPTLFLISLLLMALPWLCWVRWTLPSTWVVPPFGTLSPWSRAMTYLFLATTSSLLIKVACTRA